MTPPEIAQKLLAFYAGDPARWTKGCYARNADSVKLGSANHPTAACWCLHGAMRILPIPHTDQYAFAALWAANHTPNWQDAGDALVEWNDAPERTFEEVVARLQEIAAG